MKKLKVFLAVGLLCCGLSMSMAEAKTMTLDKTKVLVPQGFSVANDDLKFKKGTVVELNVSRPTAQILRSRTQNISTRSPRSMSIL